MTKLSINGNKFYTACRTDDIKTAKYIISIDPEIINKEPELFIMACVHNSYEIVKHLVSIHPSIIYYRHIKTHMTGFMFASGTNYYKIAEFLLRNNYIDVFTNLNGDTGFGCACNEGNIELVELMLSIDPNIIYYKNNKYCISNSNLFYIDSEDIKMRIIRLLLSVDFCYFETELDETIISEELEEFVRSTKIVLEKTKSIN